MSCNSLPHANYEVCALAGAEHCYSSLIKLFKRRSSC